MENAAREGGFFQHINQQLRQITGISRAAGLVLHHIKLVALGGGFEHGFHKIAAVFAEYPGAAHNRAVGVGGQRQQFATVQMMGLVAQLRTRKARTAQPAAVLATVFADLPDDAIIEL